jgi:two-component system chemotaxis response regulator CheY
MLIVDDSEFMRSLIKRSVRGHDINVIGEAEDGITGVEKYKEHMPDIVTMDLAMYEGNGTEALKAIMLYNPEANVIVVSSTAGQKPVADKAMALGAKAVLEKGFIQSDLVHCIQNILKK